MAEKPTLLELLSTDDPTEIFEIIEEIAAGAFGVVVKGVHKPTKSVVAVKICSLEEEDDDLANEINILKKLNHPNVVKFFGAYRKENEIYIAMELCEAGSVNNLFEVLEQGLSEPDIAYIVRESLKGLSYLHSTGIIHRDMKAPNVLMTNKGAIKLADFGVSAVLQTKDQKRNSFVGTPWWMAPEIIQSCRDINYAYDYRVDTWALGIMCIELAEMKPPRAEFQPMEVLYEIINNEPPTLSDPSRWSKNFSAFISACLEKDQTARPDAKALLSHVFVSEKGKVGSAESIAKLISAIEKRALDYQNQEEETEGDDEDEEPEDQPAAKDKAEEKKSVKAEPKKTERKTTKQRTVVSAAATTRLKTVKVATYKPKTMKEAETYEGKILAERLMAEQVKQMQKQQKKQLAAKRDLEFRHREQRDKLEKKIDKDKKKIKKADPEFVKDTKAGHKEEILNIAKAHAHQLKEKKKDLMNNLKENIKKLEKDQKQAQGDYKDKLKQEQKKDEEVLKNASTKDSKKAQEAAIKEKIKVKELEFISGQMFHRLSEEKRGHLKAMKTTLEQGKTFMDEECNKRLEQIKRLVALMEDRMKSCFQIDDKGLEAIQELEGQQFTQQESEEKFQLQEQQQTEITTTAKNEPKFKEQFKRDLKVAKKNMELEAKRRNAEELKSKKSILGKSELKDLTKKKRDKIVFDLTQYEQISNDAFNLNRLQKEGIFQLRQKEDELRLLETLLAKKHQLQRDLLNKKLDLQRKQVQEQKEFYQTWLQETEAVITQCKEEQDKWLDGQRAELKAELSAISQEFEQMFTDVSSMYNEYPQARSERERYLRTKIDEEKKKLNDDIKATLDTFARSFEEWGKIKKKEAEEERKSKTRKMKDELNAAVVEYNKQMKLIVKSQSTEMKDMIKKLNDTLQHLIQDRYTKQKAVMDSAISDQKKLLEAVRISQPFIRDDAILMNQYVTKQKEYHAKLISEQASKFSLDLSNLEKRVKRKLEVADTNESKLLSELVGEEKKEKADKKDKKDKKEKEKEKEKDKDKDKRKSQVPPGGLQSARDGRDKEKGKEKQERDTSPPAKKSSLSVNTTVAAAKQRHGTQGRSTTGSSNIKK